MHHHTWDSYFHFPLAAVWMSMPWWLDFDTLSKIVMFLIGVAIGGLQIAYLIRKHLHFNK